MPTRTNGKPKVICTASVEPSRFGKRVRGLGKALYNKIDRQTTYEEKLRMLGVFDPNVLASCKRFREARNDLMHEKAVGLDALKTVDIRNAQEEAMLGVEFVKSIGSKFEIAQGRRSLRTSS